MLFRQRLIIVAPRPGIRPVAAFFGLLCLVFHPVMAQSPSGTFDQLQLQIVERETDDPPARQPLQYRPLPRDLDLSQRLRATERPRVTMADGKVVMLPLKLSFTVSSDRRTVLQHGDALMRMHPVRTDLFWINEDGTVGKEVRNRFDGNARLDMSQDGFTVVAGNELFEPDDDPVAPIVDLYSPRGNRIWSIRLDTGTAVSLVRALTRGRGAVIVTNPKADPLSDNRLLILRERGVEQAENAGFGVLQKIVPLVPTHLVFVQGTAAFGVIQTDDGAVLWSEPERIRLVGPMAAVADAKATSLYLATGERIGTDTLYRWTITVFDLSSGQGRGQIQLEGAFPGTADEVFTEVKRDSVTVHPPGQPIKIEIRPRR